MAGNQELLSGSTNSFSDTVQEPNFFYSDSNLGIIMFYWFNACVPAPLEPWLKSTVVYN